MDIYEFKEDDVYKFASHVRTTIKESGDELRFQYCPYCKGGDGYRKDTYTFAINRHTGAFNCKRSSCGVKGNMLRLSADFDFSLGKIADEYFRPRKRYRSFKTPSKPIEPKPPAIEYLATRGISEETARKYEITVRNDEEPNILVFPFYDERGILRFVKYRKTDFKKGVDKSKEWCESNCKPILFGMKQCDIENKTLIVTEGQLDQLAVIESGVENAVSVPMGCQAFTWIPYCWNWMQNFDTIIVFGDYEKGKITLLDEFSRRFGQRVKHVRESDYKDCKDANEILLKYGKQQVIDCVENAVALPVKQVIDLSQVEDVDIFAIEKCSTGIKELDRLLYGGLPFGGVTLITAKAGSGKSTFASQILIRAKHQGFKCFAYSGELPNFLFKSWTSYQVAGDKVIFEYQNPNTGYEGYSISNTNKKLISEWYKGCIYIYDNTALDVTEESIGLLKIIESVIQQYGVRVVLLDNLMTAMIMDVTDGTNEYARQTDFVNKLRLIALRYNVLIMLIAHLRKSNTDEVSNDDIAGSSNIPNLAMITITYERGKKKDDPEDIRYIRLIKNRLFGKLNTKGIEVKFNPKSRRIFGEGDDPDFDYGFNPAIVDTFQKDAEWAEIPEGDDIGF